MRAALEALLAAVGYGPSLVWCRVASRRWGTGDLGVDIGLQSRLADLGAEPVPVAKANPESLRNLLKSEIDKWGPIIKKAGVYAD